MLPQKTSMLKKATPATSHPSWRRGLNLLACTLLIGSANAQVHYHPDGNPWKQKARSGPDAELDGWYYNLGITGLRVQLLENAPRHLLVKHVFEDTPAARAVKVGDLIIGAAGKAFTTDHRNGYGMDTFGPEGPILDFALALEECQEEAHKGRLALTLQRKAKPLEVVLRVGNKYGAFGPDFPAGCKKSAAIRDDLYEYLIAQQQDDGSWGGVVENTFAPLALLASGKRKYRAAVKKNVRFHANSTSALDSSSLINWRYTSAAMVMSEYYLATHEKWIIKELEEVYAFLLSSQYTDMTQISPQVKETHPAALPKLPTDAYGGWGHNPGFEGYGPICMLTGQGALALSLMSRCGLEIDRERLDAAFDFLERGTGRNGYVWYEDQAAGQDDWADMGRTGVAGIANRLSPYDEPKYAKRARAHATIIGAHPESFPDTHGSPPMGMAFAALAAHGVAPSFRSLMDENRWWFTLAQCTDGSFYYQPNRDNAGYGAASRTTISAVVAFILTIPEGSLAMTAR